MRKVVIGIMIVFFIVVICFTIYSVTFYQYSLPKVELGFKDSGNIICNIEKTTNIKSISNSEFNGQVKFTIDFSDDLKYFYLYKDDILIIEKLFENKKNPKSIEAVITDITSTNDTELLVTASFNSEDFFNDETVVVKISKSSPFFETLIPKDALHYDPILNKHYLLIVEEVDGAWGKDYKLAQEYLDIIMIKDDVAGSIFPISNNPFVIKSDQPVFNGDKVRFYS